jgi:membrane protein YqaA with SNARE-associated domain
VSDAPVTAKSSEPPAPKRRGVWSQFIGLTAALLRMLNRLAESGWSGTAAAAWSLLQSSVVPGPSDAVLIPLGLADPRKAIPLSLWTIAGSVVGALIGYGIGALAYDSIGLPLLTWLGVTSSQLAQVSALVREKGWLVIALGSLPLLSSKAAAIVAGAFGMPTGEFVLVTLVVRGGRFLVEGLLLRFAGGWVKRWVSRRDGSIVP